MPPGVHFTADHLPADVAARVASGTWVRVRTGAYIAGPDASGPAGRELLERARLVALARQLRSEHVISHASAALVWGLPLPRPPRYAHVTGTTHQTGRSRDVVRHVCALEPDDVATVHGQAVTSLERTAVDCAATLGPHAGLMIADAALRAGASRSRCLALLATMRGHRGVAVARAVLDLADDGAESAGESTARFVLLRAGLPAPITQLGVPTALGDFWADLGWPDWRLLGEYDGESKYEGEGAARALRSEKRRQAAIEAAGYRIVRITRHDVADPSQLVRRIVAAAPDPAAVRVTPRRELTADRVDDRW